jgi:hypothetical protein
LRVGERAGSITHDRGTTLTHPIHIHVTGEDGEAKFWVEPIVSLAMYHGLSSRRLREIQKVVEAHEDEIVAAWRKYFGKR